MIDMRDVRQKYSTQKSHAKRRGIEFKLTFDQWWSIWKPHWNNRGVNKGNFVMCRTMDKGAYEVGNVRIDTVEGNARTRSLVAYDNKMQEIKSNNKRVIDEENKDPSEFSDFQEDWLPGSLKKGYGLTSVWD